MEQSPISRIEAIQALHFPELEPEVRELYENGLQYRTWLNEGAQLRLAAKAATPPKDHLDKISVYFNPLLASRTEIVSRAKEISKGINES